MSRSRILRLGAAGVLLVMAAGPLAASAGSTCYYQDRIADEAFLAVCGGPPTIVIDHIGAGVWKAPAGTTAQVRDVGVSASSDDGGAAARVEPGGPHVPLTAGSSGDVAIDAPGRDVTVSPGASAQNDGAAVCAAAGADTRGGSKQNPSVWAMPCVPYGGQG